MNKKTSSAIQSAIDRMPPMMVVVVVVVVR
jgi:hypothetical protein